MLVKSDVSVAEALEKLARVSLEAALLVPTPTSLDKSILDATGPVREYLRSKGIHDFDRQEQGPEHKVIRECFFVTAGALERSNVSMYRPVTKSGDPRIWFGAATRHHARAWNLLALVVVNETIYVLNMSDPDAVSALDNASSPFRRAVDTTRHTSEAFDELMGMLREVCRRGFVRTLRPGDTGVGMTLETLLGIDANSKQAPDFKGIELKARRHRGVGRDNRSTLFSKVPNWRLSPVGGAVQLLMKRGYTDKDGRQALYHTLRGDRTNSLGLMLEVDPEPDWLLQVHVDKVTQRREHDVAWEMPVLKQDLAAKHRETFWVHAACRGSGEVEEFHYFEVKHTSGPMVNNLSALIEAGVITVDYALHLKGTRARDHGYLFKIHPDNIGALFPPPSVYALC
jgi:hypothetical protein